MHFLKHVEQIALHILRCFKCLIKTAITKFFLWLKNIAVALLALWRSLGPLWLRSLGIFVLVIVFAYLKLQEFVKPKLTKENIYTVKHLNSGWNEFERQAWYYTPQGTELLGIEYEWFVNLELPLSHERLATEENMRGWGFIVAPSQRADQFNPGNLPVGFSKHIDPVSDREHLDIGCAACHTGELHYKGVALRIDGGQAVQSIPNAKRGEFITTLGASVLETLYNPGKWDRFASRTVGSNKNQRAALRKRFKAFAKHLRSFTQSAGAAKYYPVEEGRGRTDAVGRIGNVVFGFDLDEPDNYRVADAPASYPFLWDIWRFDWVQYTGFTNQAMARNVGESLGVLAPIKLVNPDGSLIKGKEFAQTLVNIEGMHCVEDLLRKLKPPAWPEDILGKIDVDLALRGKTLFQEKCVHCHGPHISKPYQWQIATEVGEHIDNQVNLNPEWDQAGEVTKIDGIAIRKDQRESIWSLPWLDVKQIGTDSKLADNFVDNLYDPSKLVPGASKVNAGDGLQLLLNVLIPDLYQAAGIDSPQQVAAYDGLNVPFRIENKRAYTARPLHGVWATPPFLHNGSIPTIYDLLSTLEERPKSFYVGNREYNPQKLGYITQANPGSFLHDTTIAGNHNTGHVFTDDDSPGRIGKRLSESERFALIEYIKVMGNPDFDQALKGDPLNWANYSPPPNSTSTENACKKVHSNHILKVGSL